MGFLKNPAWTGLRKTHHAIVDAAPAVCRPYQLLWSGSCLIFSHSQRKGRISFSLGAAGNSLQRSDSRVNEIPSFSFICSRRMNETSAKMAETWASRVGLDPMQFEDPQDGGASVGTSLKPPWENNALCPHPVLPAHNQLSLWQPKSGRCCQTFIHQSILAKYVNNIFISTFHDGSSWRWDKSCIFILTWETAG